MALYGLALRNLRLRLWRTLLTLAGIVLGVAVVVAVGITNRHTLASVDAVIAEAAGEAHLSVVPAELGGTARLPAGTLARVRRDPEVELAVPLVFVRTLPDFEARDWQVELHVGGGSVSAFQLWGVDWALDPQVRGYVLAEGRLPDPQARRWEVVLPAAYARDRGLEVGETVRFVVPGGGVAPFQIVGLLADRGAARANGGQVGFAPLEQVQEAFRLGSRLDQVDVRAVPQVAASPQRLEALRKRLDRRLGGRVNVEYPASRGELFTQIYATYQRGLSFFGAMALFVGAYLIYNVFSMTVVERTREIGMLRAVGASRRQILGLVLAEAAGLGVLGVLLGLAGGVLLARGLTAATLRLQGLPAEPIRPAPADLVRGGLLGLAVTLVAALWPARQAARIPPLEALRPVTRQAESPWVRHGWKVGLLAGGAAAWILAFPPDLSPDWNFRLGSAAIVTFLLSATLILPPLLGPLARTIRRPATRLLGAPGQVGAGNLVRDRGRSSLTLAALMVGVALVVGVGTMTASFREDLAGWVDRAIGGDLYVRSPVEMDLRWAERLAAEPGVAAVSPASFFGVKVRLEGREQTLVFEALDPDRYLEVADFQFAGDQDEAAALAALREGGHVFITPTLRDRYGLRVGDPLRIRTRRGWRTYRIAGVVVEFTSQGRILIGTLDDARRDFGVRRASVFVLKAAPGVELAALRRQLKARYERRLPVQVQTGEEFRTQVLRLADQTFALLGVLVLIAVAVGSLGVVTTLTMNVLERTREIGVLRALGMTRRQVRRMIAVEAFALGLAGGGIGLGVGLFLSRTFVDAFRILLGYKIRYVLPPSILAEALVLALGVSVVAGLYPARRAAGLEIVEAIHHE